MKIRSELDPMGMGGRAWYVPEAAALAKLPRTAAELVSPRVAEIFRDVPAWLGAMADRAPLAGMRRWLTSLRDTRCELEVYATRYTGREVRLRFHVTETWAPSFRGAPGKAAVPCPEIVKAVHAITGHIDTQFGCSGTLVALDEMKTLGQLIEAQVVLGADDLAETVAKRPALQSYAGIYEADGDWLCAAPDGRTLSCGGEWIDEPIVEHDADIAATLDRYFEALLERRRFTP
ncbi:Hypothetical protein A7982_02276 [Minicystis rosea]|nr:Hypothetical protein A7982_02276 [Minicystis rosea]